MTTWASLHMLLLQAVVGFLRTELRFEDHELRQVITRFPAVLGHHIKAHLKPHLVYLRSLGVAREQVTVTSCKAGLTSCTCGAWASRASR